MTEQSLGLGLAGLTIAGLAWRWRASVPGWRAIDRIGAVVTAVAVVALWSLGAAVVAQAPSASWNAARLTWTYSLRYGYHLFYPPTEGPILSSVYGPVGAVAFLPATVFGTPTNAVLAAAVLQVLFVAGALLGFATRVARRAGAPAPLGVAAGATACLLLAWQPGSFQWLTRVHPDGVALALGLAACALLVTGDGGSPSPRALRLSAAAAVLTCWAKQVEVAVPAALVFIVWWAHGRAVAIRYLAWTAGLGTAVSAAMLALLGRPMIFNMFVEMASQPWYRPGIDGLLWQLHSLALSLRAAAALIAVALLAALTTRRDHPVAARPWMPPLACALLLLPIGALGANKIGGEQSAFHSVYYLFAALAALLIDAGRERTFGRAVAYGCLAVAIVGAWSAGQWTTRDPRKSIWDNDQERAYAFARSHPDEAWFPGQPLASLLADGRLYHYEYAILDRYLAGYEPTPAHVRTHLPPRLRWVAGINDLWSFRYVPDLTVQTTLPELPGWFVRTRPPG